MAVGCGCMLLPPRSSWFCINPDDRVSVGWSVSPVVREPQGRRRIKWDDALVATCLAGPGSRDVQGGTQAFSPLGG